MSKSIIKDHLISYLLDNDLVCAQQFGHMQSRSTCLQLLNALNDSTQARESNTKVDIMYLDFMRPFYTVAQERLLHKISRHEIKDPLHG